MAQVNSSILALVNPHEDELERRHLAVKLDTTATPPSGGIKHEVNTDVAVSRVYENWRPNGSTLEST